MTRSLVDPLPAVGGLEADCEDPRRLGDLAQERSGGDPCAWIHFGVEQAYRFDAC